MVTTYDMLEELKDKVDFALSICLINDSLTHLQRGKSKCVRMKEKAFEKISRLVLKNEGNEKKTDSHFDDPHNTRLYFAYAYVCALTGRNEKALGLLERNLSKNKFHCESLVLECVIRSSNEETNDRALLAIESAIQYSTRPRDILRYSYIKCELLSHSKWTPKQEAPMDGKKEAPPATDRKQDALNAINEYRTLLAQVFHYEQTNTLLHPEMDSIFSDPTTKLQTTIASGIKTLQSLSESFEGPPLMPISPSESITSRNSQSKSLRRILTTKSTSAKILTRHKSLTQLKYSFYDPSYFYVAPTITRLSFRIFNDPILNSNLQNFLSNSDQYHKTPNHAFFSPNLLTMTTLSSHSVRFYLMQIQSCLEREFESNDNTAPGVRTRLSVFERGNRNFVVEFSSEFNPLVFGSMVSEFLPYDCEVDAHDLVPPINTYIDEEGIVQIRMRLDFALHAAPIFGSVFRQKIEEYYSGLVLRAQKKPFFGYQDLKPAYSSSPFAKSKLHEDFIMYKYDLRNPHSSVIKQASLDAYTPASRFDAFARQKEKASLDLLEPGERKSAAAKVAEKLQPISKLKHYVSMLNNSSCSRLSNKKFKHNENFALRYSVLLGIAELFGRFEETRSCGYKVVDSVYEFLWAQHKQGNYLGFSNNPSSSLLQRNSSTLIQRPAKTDPSDLVLHVSEEKESESKQVAVPRKSPGVKFTSKRAISRRLALEQIYLYNPVYTPPFEVIEFCNQFGQYDYRLDPAINPDHPDYNKVQNANLKFIRKSHRVPRLGGVIQAKAGLNATKVQQFIQENDPTAPDPKKDKIAHVVDRHVRIPKPTENFHLSFYNGVPDFSNRRLERDRNDKSRRAYALLKINENLQINRNLEQDNYYVLR